MMKHDIKTDKTHHGIRLDTLISSVMQLCSRNRAAELICSGDILVNSLQKKPGYKIKPQDLISADISDHNPESTVAAEDILLQVLFEDAHIIVINKPPGMVVHPAPGNMTGTLVNALMFHCPGIVKSAQDSFRPGIVHRLDKDTSGVMVAAKTKQALKFLQKEFKFRRVEKRYLALVSGHFATPTGEIVLPIGRHPVKRRLMAINHDNGKPSVTRWTVKKNYKDTCLVEALLKTGRTHQIRVHFYAIDHPLIGDPVYQPRRFRKQKSLVDRQMLHSWKLSFRHPYSGRRVSFECAPPQDFLKTQQMLSGMK